MVMEVFRSYLDLMIVFSAVLAAIAGIVTLEAFFRNRLKRLFEDKNYLVFFFLVTGYFLYAIGEIAYYLTKNLFADDSSMGIADVYWTGGAVLILVSFASLALTLFKRDSGTHGLRINTIFGFLVVAAVFIFVFGVSRPNYFFGYFYPIISSLIVAFSLSAVHFFRQIPVIGPALRIFFLSSSAILAGDLLFTYTLSSGIYSISMLAVLGDGLYLLGYTLSLVAFVTLRLNMHQSSQQ